MSQTPMSVVRVAKIDAEGRTGIPSAKWTVVSDEPRMWLDNALGLPEPGMVYPQVWMPGSRLVLAGGGRRLVYHTSSTGAKLGGRGQFVFYARIRVKFAGEELQECGLVL